MMLRAITLALPLLGAATASAAPLNYQLPPETAVFRPAPGVDLAQIHCVACHSADYLSMQPPGKGEGFWKAEVTKMVKVFGAQIPDSDVPALVGYLTKAY